MVPATIADGLRHTSPARLPWEVTKMLLDDGVTVDFATFRALMAGLSHTDHAVA